MKTRNHLPTISRRDFLKVSVLTAASAALSSCSALRARPAPSSSGQVQLVYQDWRTEWYPRMVQEMLDEFHTTHPSIRVFYIPDPPDVEESLLADMQAGTAPDVFAGCCSFFPILAQSGYTLDLRPYVAADLDQATIADWNPAQYAALFTRDGQQYGLPKYHGALALFYNKNIFNTYGVDYPDESWDHNDYLEAMRLLTHDRNGDGVIDLWGSTLDISWERLQVHINGWGGHLVDPENPTRLLMCEPEALAALEWIRARMWADHVMASPLDVQKLGTRDAFLAGKVAMVEDGSWALKDILTDAQFRIGVAPFPAGPARRVTLATTDGFGIYRGTRHPEAAWELMKFLISKDYGLAMARANYLQPARASLVDAWVDMIQTDFPEETLEVNLGVFAEGQRQGYAVTGETFADMGAARRIATSAWDEVFTLGRASSDLLVEACQQIQAAETGAILPGG